MHANDVLAAVRHRLFCERLAVGARQAAWGSALIALLAVAIHLYVRPLTLQGLLLVALLPWLLAIVQLYVTRARTTECAAWADRHLGGRSAYAARLEQTASGRPSEQEAVRHLDAWLADAAPRSLARLAARPFPVLWRESVAVALVCTALAAGMLQLPTSPMAGTVAVSIDAASNDGDGVSSRPRSSDQLRDAGITEARDESVSRNDTQVANDGDTLRAGAGNDEDGVISTDESSAASGAGPAAATGPASGTGREAGDSRDLGNDAALAAPWAGDLATRLRKVAADRARPDLSAATTRTGDYLADARGPSEAPTRPGFVAPPARPPPARTDSPLGPAEQAYVRAYWMDTGALP